MPSSTIRLPDMHFVYLRPELCLQLPSHIPSRHGGTRRHGMMCGPTIICSCCSARSFRHLNLQRTFTSKSLPGSLSLAGYPASFPDAARHARRTEAGRSPGEGSNLSAVACEGGSEALFLSHRFRRKSFLLNWPFLKKHQQQV